MIKIDSFNRKKRQFSNLANRVNQLIFNGEWAKLSAESRKIIILKLNSLYRQLSCYFSHFELKKILAAAAIFIGFPLAAQSQSFAPPQLNPFGLVPDSVSLASPVFADIDHDDDLDLFSGNYGGAMQFRENTGTVTAPLFALPQQNPFGIVTPLDDYHIAFPAFADIDHDGDLDLFIGGIYNERGSSASIQFYENTGTETAPAFAAPQANPFGLVPAFMFAMPEFADIDHDGDLDLFTGQGYGNIVFYQNNGTITQANFGAPQPNPFGIVPVNLFGSPAFSDIDHDGDLDLFVGEYYGNMQFFENTGTINSPAFASPVTNPFGLVQTNYYNFPAIADLDDDGDEDILVGEYYGSFQYFKNTEINIGIAENLPETIFDLYPNPATDGVFISFKEGRHDHFSKVIITDPAGRIVMTEACTSQSIRLNTAGLSPGIYFVRLVKADKIFTRKLIIR
jgi:hypothetical protein